jgi:hypothetical protein
MKTGVRDKATTWSQIVREKPSAVWSHFLAQSPIDTESVSLILEDVGRRIAEFDLLRLGGENEPLS